MTNLLRETISILEGHGIKETDVRWVGNSSYWSTWENFKEHADEDYDSGFGAAHVAQDLIIAGDDWWMTRGEYDGSEWWDFHRKPQLPENFTHFTKFVGSKMWVNLSSYNENIRTKQEQEDYFDEDDSDFE